MHKLQFRDAKMTHQVKGLCAESFHWKCLGKWVTERTKQTKSETKQKAKQVTKQKEWTIKNPLQKTYGLRSNGSELLKRVKL